MAKEIFIVSDPQGYRITLDVERWRHIINGHPEMRDYQDLVRTTASAPELIQRDPQHPETHYYYQLTGRGIFGRNDIYISVVIARSEATKLGFVKTAYFVEQTKKGGVLVWFNRQAR